MAQQERGPNPKFEPTGECVPKGKGKCEVRITIPDDKVQDATSAPGDGVPKLAAVDPLEQITSFAALLSSIGGEIRTARDSTAIFRLLPSVTEVGASTDGTPTRLVIDFESAEAAAAFHKALTDAREAYMALPADTRRKASEVFTDPKLWKRMRPEELGTQRVNLRPNG